VPEPRLTRFFRKLTTSSTARKRFKKDPVKAMKQAGLSPAQQKLVKSRDPEKISKAVAAEQPPGAAPIVFSANVESVSAFWGKES
jgi:hypothetical protein